MATELEKSYKFMKDFGVMGRTRGKNSWKDSVSKKEQAKAEEYFGLKPGIRSIITSCQAISEYRSS